jgi:RNA polymerase sigma-70 factor (ECF subfamily)
LLQRIRIHEADAWQRLVGLYTPLVCYWCSRWNVRGADAEDVVQEVFRVALTSLPGFHKEKPGDTFRGWLHVITRNVLRTHLRRFGRQPQASGGSGALAALQEVPDPQGDPAEEEDPPAQRSALFRRALELVRSEFEDRTWQAFWGTVVDGQSPVELAPRLGVTPAAVRKAKSRVLQRLRAELGELLD